VPPPHHSSEYPIRVIYRTARRGIGNGVGSEQRQIPCGRGQAHIVDVIRRGMKVRESVREQYPNVCLVVQAEDPRAEVATSSG